MNCTFLSPSNRTASVLPFVITLLCGLIYPATSFADSILEARPKRNYSHADHSKLSERQRWSVIVHGIRGGMLDPDLWSMRRLDRTDNRNLVPIRPFYLRSSEHEAFRLSEISTEFSFKPATRSQMNGAPALHSPIFEIGFNGDFRMGLPGEPPPVDRGYALRLSATPVFPGGIIYRSQTATVMLRATDGPLEPEKRYRLRLVLEPQLIRVYLDDELYLEHQIEEETDLQQGLVSMIGNWHPVVLHQLEVRGKERLDGVEVLYQASGLVHLSDKDNS